MAGPMLLSAWDIARGASQAVGRQTGGGRQQNLFEQQGSERDGKHSDLSGAISLSTGLGTYPSSSLESNPGFA